ncbi:hypothetical protein Pen01_11320 [Phytomonospora endophytica]|nr:hypothetical protein Pen01_11320 [Phytomonospora endophytica]
MHGQLTGEVPDLPAQRIGPGGGVDGRVATAFPQRRVHLGDQRPPLRQQLSGGQRPQRGHPDLVELLVAHLPVLVPGVLADGAVEPGAGVVLDAAQVREEVFAVPAVAACGEGPTRGAQARVEGVDTRCLKVETVEGVTRHDGEPRRAGASGEAFDTTRRSLPGRPTILAWCLWKSV